MGVDVETSRGGRYDGLSVNNVHQTNILEGCSDRSHGPVHQCKDYIDILGSSDLDMYFIVCTMKAKLTKVYVACTYGSSIQTPKIISANENDNNDNKKNMVTHTGIIPFNCIPRIPAYIVRKWHQKKIDAHLVG